MSIQHIDADAAKLAGLQIDILQKVRDGQISLGDWEWFNNLSVKDRVLVRNYWEGFAVHYTTQPKGVTINWDKVYKTLDMTVDLSGKDLNDPNCWVVPVFKGVTPNKVVQALRKLGVDVYLYTEDLDKAVPTNDRDLSKGDYTVKFKKVIEADPELKNKSANDLKKERVEGITLLERLLLELGYFLATGNHLDVENVTLCCGSRYSDGDVPSVYWRSGDRKVYVYWYGQSAVFSNLRARAVVS